MTRYKVVNSRQSQVSSDTGRLVVDDGSGYTLPTATADIKGGVRVGANLSMAGDVLSADDMRYDDSQVLTDIGDLEEGQQGLQDQIDSLNLQSLFDGGPVALTWTVMAKYGSGSNVSGFTVSVTNVVQRETPVGGYVEFTTTANWTGTGYPYMYVSLVPSAMGVMLPYLSCPWSYAKVVTLGSFSEGPYGVGFALKLNLVPDDKGQPRVSRFYYLKT